MAQPIQPPFYNTFPLSLDAAGSHVLTGELGVLHLYRAETNAGALALDALVEVQLGDTDNAWVKLGVNNKINATGFTKARFRWNAQSGVTAEFNISRDPERFSVDAPPAKQLVTSSIAGEANYSRETVTTSAGAILAANGTRQAVGLKADPSNSGVIYVASDAAVTTSTGWPLAAGETIVLNSTARIDAIASAAGQVLHVMEEDA